MAMVALEAWATAMEAVAVDVIASVDWAMAGVVEAMGMALAMVATDMALALEAMDMAAAALHAMEGMDCPATIE